MSSRALKRLQQQRLEQQAQELEQESDQESIPDSSSKAQNLFDLLNAGDDDNDDDNDNNDAVSEDERPATPPPVERTPSPAKKSKKKNKKKKGKAKEKPMDDLEALDKAIQEAAAERGQQGESSMPATNTHERRQLLSINYRYLDAEAEMKRMFGSRVVNSESRAVGRVIKRSRLTTPKVDWAPYKNQGLHMELIETVNGVQYFAFKHDETYQDAQLQFLNAVAMHDPNALMFLIQVHPYHVDGLLQVSEMAKQSGDWTVAGDCIERALYACERAFHPHFTFGSGTVRLSYQRAENRSFFLAIFRHIQFLTRRGCWRTAFEFNKLLFSLDPDNDPLGALLSMDSFALSAKEYSYLTRMYKDWKTSGKVYPVDMSDLPNFAFTSAVAQFKLDGCPSGDYTDEGSQMLREALVKFPTVLPNLYSKLGESNNQKLPLSDSAPDVYLDLLETLLVERNHELYKEPEILRWLEENAALVASAVEKQPQRQTQVQCELNKEIPLSVCRHIVLSDIQSLLAYLPSSVTNASFNMYDPLPPADSTTGYDINERIRARGGSGNNPAAANNMFDQLIQTLRGASRARQVPADTVNAIRQMIENMGLYGGGQPGDRLPGAFPEDEDVDAERFHDDEANAAGAEEDADVQRELQELMDGVTEEDLEIQRALAETYDRRNNADSHNEQRE